MWPECGTGDVRCFKRYDEGEASRNVFFGLFIFLRTIRYVYVRVCEYINLFMYIFIFLTLLSLEYFGCGPEVGRFFLLSSR